MSVSLPEDFSADIAAGDFTGDFIAVRPVPVVPIAAVAVVPIAVVPIAVVPIAVVPIAAVAVAPMPVAEVTDLGGHAVWLMKRYARHGGADVARAKAKAAKAINLIISSSLVNLPSVTTGLQNNLKPDNASAWSGFLVF